MSYTLLTFSPTGQSKACALAVAKATKQEFVELDLTHFLQRENPLVLQNTTLIVAYPVYWGRVPSPFGEYLKDKLTCIGCKALVIASFGNHTFGDALVEMEDILLQKGVSIIGAASIGCQHSFTDKIGSRRPDIGDFQILDRLAVYLNGETKGVHPPGNRPYRSHKPALDTLFMPVSKNKISSQCYEVCPTDSLAKADPSLCIHCCACIKVSNNGLRMEDPWFVKVTNHLEKTCQRRKDSELYLP